MKFFRNLFNSFTALFRKIDVAPDRCKTRYPILLVHGISVRDNWFVPSWGHIPKYLRRGGADVYLGDTEAWASYKTNGDRIKNKVQQILNKTGKDKVNIIAHSKGGVDARYAISKLGLGDKVASLTTVSSPHRGTCIADIITDSAIPQSGYRIGDFLAGLFGDQHPETNIAIGELRRDRMAQFNHEVNDVDGVYYQSYGAHMLQANDDVFFPYTVVKENEGENDGMICLDSLRWGEFQQLVEGGDGKTGISHGQISGILGDVAANTNIPMLYVAWVERLKEKGY